MHLRHAANIPGRTQANFPCHPLILFNFARVVLVRYLYQLMKTRRPPIRLAKRRDQNLLAKSFFVGELLDDAMHARGRCVVGDFLQGDSPDVSSYPKARRLHLRLNEETTAMKDPNYRVHPLHPVGWRNMVSCVS